MESSLYYSTLYKNDLFFRANRHVFCTKSATTAYLTQDQACLPEDGSPTAAGADLPSFKLVYGNPFPRLLIWEKFLHPAWPHHLTACWFLQCIIHCLQENWASKSYWWSQGRIWSKVSANLHNPDSQKDGKRFSPELSSDGYPTQLLQLSSSKREGKTRRKSLYVLNSLSVTLTTKNCPVIMSTKHKPWWKHLEITQFPQLLTTLYQHK